MGTIHVYDTMDGPKGIVLHHSDVWGRFDPHMHAIEPQVRGTTADEFVQALARQNPDMPSRYSEILPKIVGEDKHIWCRR